MNEVGVSWTEGLVDTSGEHIRLCFGDAWIPVALVAPAGQRRFTVEFLLDPAAVDDAAEVLQEARRELNLYLVELNEPNPWGYAIYHCSTASNLYSSIHWQHRGAAEEVGNA